MTKTVFFGSSLYSLIILKKLLSLSNFSATLIVTKSDKAIGRHQTITPNLVALFAKNHHLPLLQIEEFSSIQKSLIKKYQSDLGLCVAFGPPFFDNEMINLFPRKIVNIHPSPLPKYRGATPGPWQIINGETTSAITFFQIDPLPDHGPIIAQIPFKISPHETSDSFYQKAFTLAADNLDKILLSPTSIQDETQKSYYPKLTKQSGKINWSWHQDKIYRFINAMIPWPVAWTEIIDKNNRTLKMKIFSSKLSTRNSQLTIDSVQIEGKKPTLWSEISLHYSLKK